MHVHPCVCITAAITWRGSDSTGVATDYNLKYVNWGTNIRLCLFFFSLTFSSHLTPSPFSSSHPLSALPTSLCPYLSGLSPTLAPAPPPTPPPPALCPARWPALPPPPSSPLTGTFPPRTTTRWRSTSRTLCCLPRVVQRSTGLMI